ncbi:MAG: DNA methyltransferase [Bradymonadaceae bacterium]
MTWILEHGEWQNSPPSTVDHIICDPPYNEITHEGGRTSKTDDGSRYGKHEKGFDPVDPHDFAPELLEISQGWVLCFCAFEMLGDYQKAVGLDQYVRSGIWLKPNPTPQMTGDRPGTPAEAIAIMHPPGRKEWNGGGSAGIWEHNVPKSTMANGYDERVHQTQKPVDLMVDLVTDFTQPGDVIWDPYAGSGTTGVACVQTGRDFIGHEKDREHYENARLRLAGAEKGNTLEEEKAGQESLLEPE